jgi:ubiquinone/menaquinone biosynthesis C-methylase UbiE
MPHVTFDRAAAYYDSTRGFPEGVAQAVRDAVVSFTGASTASRFLELGVGTGRVGLPFIAGGYPFAGVDISLPMLGQLAQKLAADPQAPTYHYQLLHGDITRLPFGDASFDVAFAVHVLHLVDGWQEAVAEARRVLRRPGGWLLVGVSQHDKQLTSQRHLVDEQWGSILAELNVDPSALRPGVQARGSAGTLEVIEPYLRELGAETQRAVLLEYAESPLSARAAAQRHIDRLYSGDWLLPDDVHAEAARRLANWVETQCPDPDRPMPGTGNFEVLAARW